MAVELSRDGLSAVLRRMSSVSVGQAACVSKLWSEAAKVALEDPKHRFVCEFGPGCSAAIEDTWRASRKGIGEDVPWKDLMDHCQTVLTEMSHEQHEARCHHFIGSVIRDWKLTISEGDVAHDLQRRFSPVLVLPLPQSIWLRFSLPLDVIPEEPSQPMPLKLRGICASSDPVLLDLPKWRMPADDTERFWDSHTTGVYAWQARSGEGAFQLPSDDKSAGSDVLHMAIYIHFEQLLGSHPHTMSAYVVPQRIPVPEQKATPSVSPSPHEDISGSPAHFRRSKSEYLEIVADFCKLRSEGRLGGFRARLAPCIDDGGPNANAAFAHGENLHWQMIPQHLQVFELQSRCHHTNPAVMRFINSRICKSAGGLQKDQEGLCSLVEELTVSRTQLEILEELCSTEALLDFALYNNKGQLLIGRSGVEMWESELASDGASRLDEASNEHPLLCWRVNFLVDGLDNSMWENRVEITPRTSQSRESVMMLSLTSDAFYQINKPF